MSAFCVRHLNHAAGVTSHGGTIDLGFYSRKGFLLPVNCSLLAPVAENSHEPTLDPVSSDYCDQLHATSARERTQRDHGGSP